MNVTWPDFCMQLIDLPFFLCVQFHTQKDVSNHSQLLIKPSKESFLKIIQNKTPKSIFIYFHTIQL